MKIVMYKKNVVDKYMELPIPQIFPSDTFGFLIVISFLLVTVIEFKTLLGLIGFTPDTFIYSVTSGIFIVIYSLGFIIYQKRITEST